MEVTSIYLSLLGGIFFTAFTSYHVQYPGLSSSWSTGTGCGGIMPIDNVLMASFPMLHRLVIKNDEGAITLDGDSLVDIFTLIGMTSSLLALTGKCQHGLVYLLLVTLYFVLKVLGQTFYSFQWDMLLLETGFVSALCISPWTSLKIKRTSSTSKWPLIFVLFKLMLMSGVVKIQANCPTWTQLTALEYHYATQCLPGPFAWYAHQLSPFLQRISVAATLLIEIPMTFLLILPFTCLRRIGAAFQIALQLLIILTGNYNFFNVLTITLCLPCMEGDEWSNLTKSGGVPSRTKKLERNQVDKRLPTLIYLQVAAFFIFIFWVARNMFEFGWHDDGQGRYHRMISLKWTVAQCEELVLRSVPCAVAGTLICLTLSALISIYCVLSSKKQTLAKGFITSANAICHAFVCAVCIGVTAVPLIMLIPDQLKKGGGFVGAQTVFIPLWQLIQPYGVANGYGLFRRMTGVGTSSNNVMEGWGGVSPSVVARPEIVLEGVFRNSTDLILQDRKEVWRELQFRWKPGNVYKRPKQIAPHQPRLDWQMWFAALGHYQHNPWLISLMYRLLDGTNKNVLDLLDEPGIISGKEQLMKIRAVLWDYDFTRLDLEWNRRIPNASILKNHSSWLTCPKQYWARRNRRPYPDLPELSPNDPGVQKFLRHHGLLPNDHLQCQGKKQGRSRCSVFKFKSRPAFHICNGTEFLRATKMYLLGFFGSLLVVCLIPFWHTRNPLPKDEGTSQHVSEEKKT